MNRYIIGIDLGTTNIAVSYLNQSNFELKLFSIRQEVERGVFQEKPLLPACCYLDEKEDKVGQLAKTLGAFSPTRFISSAKSWLCNESARRKDKILPIDVFDTDRRLSPLEVTTLYLKHIIGAWNEQFAKDDPSLLFENQDIVIGIPASFDQVARKLTEEAIQKAGICKFSFIEEPQAAFYAWIFCHQKEIDRIFKATDSILVVDVGGGTCDFSLIKLSEALEFEREQVGRHLLLGGDNMDEFLAHFITHKYPSVEIEDWQQLVFKAKEAKEALLTSSMNFSFVLTGKGRHILKKAASFHLEKEEVVSAILEAFFKKEPLNAAANIGAKRGLYASSLPFEKESSIIRHLAEFLVKTHAKPNFLLFNGGTLSPSIFRERILDVLKEWYPLETIQTLTSESLDLAVAKGAAFYGATKKGIGKKIISRIPSSYFIEVEENKALCIIPKGTDFGQAYESKKLFYITPNTPVQFRLLHSNTLLNTVQDELYPIVEEEMVSLPPLYTRLNVGKLKEKQGVTLEAKLNEMGAIELRLITQDKSLSFCLEFNLSQLVTLPLALDTTFTFEDTVDLRNYFKNILINDSSEVIAQLEKKLELPKNQWPPYVLRLFFDELLDSSDYIKKAPEKFWNMAGFFLRPGLGHALDEMRIKEIWKRILADFKVNRPGELLLQKWICYRRIALGLPRAAQIQLASQLLSDITKVLQGKLLLKNRQAIYLYKEQLRTLAAFELIDVDKKIHLSSLIVKKIKQGEALDEEIFLLGRLGARTLLNPSLTHIIGPSYVEKWLEELEPFIKKEKNRARWLCLSLARKSSYWNFNLNHEIKERMIALFLEDGEFQKALNEEVKLKSCEKEQLLGEVLPLGISLGL